MKKTKSVTDEKVVGPDKVSVSWIYQLQIGILFKKLIKLTLKLSLQHH